MNEKDKRVMTSRTHEEMVGKWMQDPLFKKEYDALEAELYAETADDAEKASAKKGA